MVRGTPDAVVAEEPKPLRMSDRTMPESSGTLTPLEPSPGNGPPVSSGTSVTRPEPVEDDADAESEAVVEPPPDVGESDVPEHPDTNTLPPRAPKRPRVRRPARRVRRW